jgi:ammonium transporter, Amt family
MLIWGGWFGFNGGSSFKGDAIGSLALVNTHIAACTAAFTVRSLLLFFDFSDFYFQWGFMAYIEDSHYHLSEFMNGAYCGLAAVTPGAGFILVSQYFVFFRTSFLTP